MEVQWMSPQEIYPYVNNAKSHPPEQIEKIAKQIHNVGWTQPIVVDAKKVVIAGHGRLEAAKKLGIDQVPVVKLEHLTEEQAMAYRIADNKVAESEWEMDFLKFELGTLDRMNVDLSLTGFDFDEIKSILDDPEIPQEIKITEKDENSIVVICETEQLQEQIFEELSARPGVMCKIL